MEPSVASSGDAWERGDTLADWAEDADAELVTHLDLSHGRWRYWAKRLPAHGDAASQVQGATDWVPLGLDSLE